MKVGNYDVPDNRLIPSAVSDAKKIYDVVKTSQIKTSEMGKVFGYKTYTTGVFYRRLNSMIGYGLLEKISSTSFKITNLGMELCYPDPDKENILKNKAILNVGLWKELFDKCGKTPPISNFWIQLKNIAKVEPNEAQKIESQVKKWYMDDIALVTLDPLGHPILDDGISKGISNEKHLRSGSAQGEQMSQQLLPPQIQSNPNNELIQFGKVSLALPKKDLKKQWDKLQKYMEIYLEDYVEESDSQPNVEMGNVVEEEIDESKSAQEIIEEETEKFAEKMK